MISDTRDNWPGLRTVVVLTTAIGLCVAAAAKDNPKPVAAAATGPEVKPAATTMTMAVYLDRLMQAESGGDDDAKNPHSSALGPYQFVEATFLEVTRRYFLKDIENLNEAQILALRTNRAFARKAAAAYTRENAAVLAAAGFKPTFPRLRLAFLLGAGGAIRVLRAPQTVRLIALLGPSVIRANSFMARMTAGGLIRRAAADILTDPATTAGVRPGKLAKTYRRRPRIRVRCNLGLASCRRWLALERKKLRRRARKTRLSKR